MSFDTGHIDYGAESCIAPDAFNLPRLKNILCLPENTYPQSVMTSADKVWQNFTNQSSTKNLICPTKYIWGVEKKSPVFCSPKTGESLKNAIFIARKNTHRIHEKWICVERWS